MLSKTLAVAALAVAPALATPAVNVYFGQSGAATDRLRNYCDGTSFEYITIGFINSSPENDPSTLRYPGSDFSTHCIGAKYQDSDGTNSRLLSQCGELAADVRYCQKQGKKVLLSIGGDGDQYGISSPPNGEEFADFIWGAFGPKQALWTKARPFDDYYGGYDSDADKYFSFDGFDFDIEQNFSEHAS
jgi:chitinase